MEGGSVSHHLVEETAVVVVAFADYLTVGGAEAGYDGRVGGPVEDELEGEVVAALPAGADDAGEGPGGAVPVVDRVDTVVRFEESGVVGGAEDVDFYAGVHPPKLLDDRRGHHSVAQTVVAEEEDAMDLFRTELRSVLGSAEEEAEEPPNHSSPYRPIFPLSCRVGCHDLLQSPFLPPSGASLPLFSGPIRLSSSLLFFPSRRDGTQRINHHVLRQRLEAHRGARTMSDNITIHFHGHSCFTIELGEHRLLIDPFITGNPVAKVSADDLDPTHIILTHGHGDHLGDTVEIAKRTGAQVLTTFEAANYLKDQGLENVRDYGVGGGGAVDFGRIKFTIAHHSAAAPDGTYLGTAAGVIVTIGGREIYHAGDTALTYDMKLLAELHSIAVAMVPIGDNYTMGVRDAVKAVEFVRPDVAIPMHYNTFELIAADPEEFAAGVRSLGVDGVILEPGQEYSLSIADA